MLQLEQNLRTNLETQLLQMKQAQQASTTSDEVLKLRDNLKQANSRLKVEIKTRTTLQSSVEVGSTSIGYLISSETGR
jgi:hypothetical protein